jgi:hypothetical protein
LTGHRYHASGGRIVWKDRRWRIGQDPKGGWIDTQAASIARGFKPYAPVAATGPNGLIPRASTLPVPVSVLAISRMAPPLP